MQKDAKIFVAGHKGFVGSAILRALKAQGYCNFCLASRDELDLTNQEKTRAFFAKERPEYVFLAAAKVGGIYANSSDPVAFLYNNLMIQSNVIHAAYHFGVKKLLFLGSSCIYPKLAPQPISEEALLTGPLEPTNEAYAIAKIAGVKLCMAYQRQYGARFISAMPTNLYGPHDNFDLTTSHVAPALIRKFYEASQLQEPVTLWGTGLARREFLFVEDFAEASLFLMKDYESPEPINVGMGEDISIKELAETIQSIAGRTGPIIWDRTKPDGTPKKLMNNSKIRSLGWQPTISLAKGLATTYFWYCKNAASSKSDLIGKR